MPILDDIREKVKLEKVLPITKGQVWIWPYLLGHENDSVENACYGDLKAQYSIKTQQMGDIEFGLDRNMAMNDKLIEVAVADWDLTDKNEKKLPITIENLKKLPQDDLDYIMEGIDKHTQVKLADAKKKNSSGN